jgi:hypothetical protein
VKPDGIESLRAIQAAVAEVLVPELRTAFAEEAAGAVSMMVESLVAEWDTAAEMLVRDNEALRRILADGREALQSVPDGNGRAASLVREIDGELRSGGGGSLAISALTAENNRLRERLASFLELAEDTAGGQGWADLRPVRDRAYRHLRQVSLGGWSFFDVSGFREKMARERAGSVRDDPRRER